MGAHRSRTQRPRYLRRRQGRQGAYAALDLGTNNCRLLVARPVDGGFRVIDAFSRIVRLGEGLERDGELSGAAMDRTIDALKVCALKMRRRRVVRARNVATEACRRAGNRDLFLDRVRSETGLEIEIISSDEEAKLAVAGCAPLIDREVSHALVFDIGGGSTELMWVRRQDGAAAVIASASLPFGVINLSEAHGTDIVPRAVYESMIADVEASLKEFDALHGIRPMIEDGAAQMLGTSGTVTTLAGIHLKLPRYDRQAVDGSYLSADAIRVVNNQLLAMDCRARAKEPCVGPARADLVLAGCAILDAILRTWPAPGLVVADRGLREGILLGLMGRSGLRSAEADLRTAQAGAGYGSGAGSGAQPRRA
ncbi:MAG: Ppx/GppA family phosphatase [Proteobacteria bacterium]|nr:Ppx/GppA family phosphatase [Pseudomonadota bacterium]